MAIQETLNVGNPSSTSQNPSLNMSDVCISFSAGVAGWVYLMCTYPNGVIMPVIKVNGDYADVIITSDTALSYHFESNGIDGDVEVYMS